MPIGYNPTETGDIGLTFPSIADEYRTLGHAYGPSRMVMRGNVDMGTDQYGWGRDADRMANAKVASTISAYDVYNRTPRHRIIPTRMMGSTPFFGAIDQSDEAMRRWLGHSGSLVRGGGSIGALTTPEGQQYRKKILNRRAQELTALRNQQDTAPTAPTELMELSKKQAQKDEVLDAFDAIAREIETGILERSTAKEFYEWSNMFLTLLPYFGNVDAKELVNIVRVMGQLVEGEVRVIANRVNLQQIVARRNLGVDTGEIKDIEDKTRLAKLINQRAELVEAVLKDYFKIINFSLQERIMGTRAILRKYRMESLARGIQLPTQEEVVDDEDDNDYEPPQYAPLRANEDDEGAPVLDEEEAEVEVPIFDGLAVAQPQFPPYQTQAQITAEMTRRRLERGLTNDQAVREIVEEWRPLLGYAPRASTNYVAVRRTLVDNIKRYLREQGVVGRGRRVRGGRSVHHRLRAHQEGVAMRRQMEEVRRR